MFWVVRFVGLIQPLHAAVGGDGTPCNWGWCSDGKAGSKCLW
jgi:hypothetical protein